MSSGSRRWWAGDSARGVIVRNATLLTSTTGVNLLLGFAYWWVAARLLPPAAVGLGSAAISAMTLLAALSLFGFGTLLIGELPRRPAYARALVPRALVIAGSAALLLGTLFIVLAPWFSSDFDALRHSPLVSAIFVLGASLTALSLIADDIAVGLLYSELQLVRNLVFGLAKLVILIASISPVLPEITITSSWVFGLAVSLVAYTSMAANKFGLRLRGQTLGKSPLIPLIRSAMPHHLLNFTLELPRLGLPVLVTALISSTANAYFYTSLMIISLASAVTHALTKALYASNSASNSANSANIRFSLLISLGISLISSAVIIITSPLLMSVFGEDYRNNATNTLVILALLPVATSISTHYVAVHRSLGQAHRAIPLTVLGTVARFIAAGFGAIAMGLEGFALGLLASSYLEISLMTPYLYRHANLSQLWRGNRR